MTETVALAIGEEEAERYRGEFPIFGHTNYLNSCSLGPPSKRVHDALDQYQLDWSRNGAPAWWKLWMPKLEEAKRLFARLIGAAPHEVTVSHSISSALSSIASTFDYRQQPNVVCTDLDFPTIPYQWLAKSREGVRVLFASSHDRIGVPMEVYEEVLNDDVAAVATSHCFYSSGQIQPIRQLAELAHRRGAKIIVDGYHSVGVHPVDVKELDVDFYVGGTLKWLLGGPGLTFIYVREDLIPALHPTVSGWFSSAEQFSFNSLGLKWPDTADRLELGTPSVPTAYAGVAGMNMILGAGLPQIYSRIQMLTQRIVERAREDGYEICSPENANERGGIVMLRVKRPEETVNLLSSKGVTIDYRPGLIRISPHFYNTLDDVEHCMESLREIQTEV